MEQLRPDPNKIVYRDPAHVYICVGILSWVGGAPQHAWTSEFEISDEEPVNLRIEVERVARSVSPDSVPPPFHVRETRGRTSWGADSGEFVRVVLWVSEQASTALIGAAALKLFHTLAKRDRRQQGTGRITRDEAIARAKWVLTAHYGMEARDAVDSVPKDDSDLTVIAERYSTDANAWTITLQDVDKTTYSVEFGHLDGLPTVSEVSRTKTQNG